MKVNGSFILLGLDEKPLLRQEGQGKSLKEVPLTVGFVISSILSGEKVKQFTPLKALALAKRFFKETETEVDEGDFSSLREMIDQNERWTPLVLGRVLEHLIDVKGEEDKPEKKK